MASEEVRLTEADLRAPPLPRWDSLCRYGWEYHPGRTADENYLDLAIALARNSEALEGHMGCCLVRDGEVIGQAINCALFGYARSDVHAEAALISDAARRGVAVEGATLYVTRAPCTQCYKLVAVSGIRRVVAPTAMLAPECNASAESLGIDCVVLKDSDERRLCRDEAVEAFRDDDAIKAAREKRKLLRKFHAEAKAKAKAKMARGRENSAPRGDSGAAGASS